MKKLIVACAAIVAATLFSGSAFAIPGAGPAAIQAPSAAVKVSCGCHRPRYYRPACCGYYSLYTYATPCGAGVGAAVGVAAATGAPVGAGEAACSAAFSAGSAIPRGEARTSPYVFASTAKN